MQKYKSIGLLLIALVFSGVAGFSAIKYLENREKALKAEYEAKVNYIEIIVPKSDLAVGDVISVDTVSLRPVPEAYIPSGALLPSDFDAIAGMTVKEPTVAGRPLLRSQLDGLTGIEKFSQLLQPGQRALTLPVDEIQSNENMLMPGDYVDLLVKLKVSQGNIKSVNVNRLLNRVLVLATGVTTVADPSYYQARGFDQGYGSITIGVDTSDIGKVLAAQEMGDLVVLMRNNDDKARGDFEDSSDLLSQNSASVRVFSNKNDQNGLLQGSYQSLTGIAAEEWRRLAVSGRALKRYEGKPSDKQSLLTMAGNNE